MPRGAAFEQLYADLQFEIANLAAQRWLRSVQSPLGGIRKAAFLRDGNEVTQMAKFQFKAPMLSGHISITQSIC
jgi:hypothetical protein